ncbi:MAG: tRNA pseudouridine(55) synthase TruB [Vulcanimicrobiaceae bacterium]
MLGFVNVFKVAGPTSAQVVARVRRLYALHAGDRDLTAGHLGTLDPQAAGVLPIAIGKATRLIALMPVQSKRYACTLVLGSTTTTQDALGETVERADVPDDWRERLARVVPRFAGAIEQIPPMYSAVHHEGRRLYEIARTGERVARKPRTVEIASLEILGTDLAAAVARLRVTCGEGTYVRTLCEDLGAAMGVPSHMGALVREASGPFELRDALTMERIAADPRAAVVTPEQVIPFPTIVLDLRGSADFRAGRAVPMPQAPASKHVFVRDESRALVGVGEALGALLAPRKVFV